MSTRGDVVAVTCLALEARIALGPGVSVICTHASQLVAALDRAAKRGASGIISFGIAGGTRAPSRCGRLGGRLQRADRGGMLSDRSCVGAGASCTRFRARCMPRSSGRMRPSHIPWKSAGFTCERVRSPSTTNRMSRRRIAAAYRIPFAACRAVIDPAHSELPPAAVTGLRHDGTADVLAVFRSVVRQPSQLPALARTALEARTAGAALRRGRRLLGVGLAFPYFREVTLDVPAAVEAI